MSDREGRHSFRKGSINSEGAIVVQGIEAKVKASAVFMQHHIPLALFPLATVEEFGHNDQTGLFWMKQTTKSTTEFPHAEIVAMYHTTVSGHVEKNKVKNLKGFKIKEMRGQELYLSVPYDEIFVDDDEVRLRSKNHTTRNCMLISFSDNLPPRQHPSPEEAASSAPPPPADELPAADGSAPLPEGEGETSGERQEGEQEATEGEGEELIPPE